MEKHEIEKGKQKRRRIVQPRSISSLPLDLITEILLRLPAKLVVRSRCVSKLWSSIITDPLFIKSFETRSSTLPTLLVCFQEGDKLFSSSIPQHQEISNEYNYDVTTIDHGHKKLYEHGYFPSIESVYGLVYFQNSTTIIIWNPSIRQFLNLPNPGKSCKGVTAYLGYDPIEGQHKVLCIYNNLCDWCWVLTLGSSNKEWRKITTKTNHQHHSIKGSFGRCINGVIYYPASNMDKSSVIMSFDVRTENFDMIKPPAVMHPDMIKLPGVIHPDTDGLITYEGRLAYVEGYNDNAITLLILEDAEKHKWLRKDLLAPIYHYDRSFRFAFHLRGMTPTGELVYSPNLFSESVVDVYFYDLKRKRFRKVKCQGMVDELRLCVGFDNRNLYTLHTFLNHTESLKSL